VSFAVSSDADSLHGRVADASDPVALRAAVEWALDFRGDVTITRRSSPQPVDGYVFDRRQNADGQVVVRLIPRDGSARLAIPLADIARIEFTGKDTASGKSFETWVNKYVQKKMAGESASIESETIE
jgi:hypothetical protein